MQCKKEDRGCKQAEEVSKSDWQKSTDTQVVKDRKELLVQSRRVDRIIDSEQTLHRTQTLSMGFEVG